MALLPAMTITVVVFLAAREPRSKIAGLALCVSSIPLLTNATGLYPDIIAASFMAASVICLDRRRKLLDVGKPIHSLPILAVLFLFLAFLTKLTAYWVVVLWLGLLAVDLAGPDRMRLFRRFHFIAAVAGAALGVAYLLTSQIIWGDPLARITSVETLAGAHLWSLGRLPSDYLVTRLTTGPVALFIKEYGIVLLLLAFGGLIQRKAQVSAWKAYFLVCILLFWFGPTSFSVYEPMPLFPRMTLPLLPAVLILAATFAAQIYDAAERRGPVFRISALMVFGAVLVFPLATHVKISMSAGVPEAEAISIIKREAEAAPGNTFLLVTSDVRSATSLEFYFGYDYPPNIDAIFAGELVDTVLSQWSDIYIFVHSERSNFLRAAYDISNFDKQVATLGRPELFSREGVALYRASEIDLVKLRQYQRF